MEGELRPSEHKLYFLGENANLEAPGLMHGAEEISIGKEAIVSSGHRLIVTSPINGSRPKIILGDGVQADIGLIVTAENHVELERLVWCGPHAVLSDTEAEYRKTGLPVSKQGYRHAGINRLIVGEGTYIGAHAVIEGAMKIGKGCVIGAGSVVRGDVPDYSVVWGVPAKLTEMFDTVAEEWIKVETEEEIADVLRRRRDRPLLSICIPTYNRSKELKVCLDSVLPQTSINGLIEVCVSDNASDDATSAVLAQYVMKYPQLRTIRQSENIGGERNFVEVVKFAKGKFAKLQGDDDYFIPGAIQPILYALLYRKSRFLLIDVLRNDGTVEVLEGMDRLVTELSIASGFISSIVVDREALLSLPELDRFIGTSLNHIYWLYALLEEDPRFTLLKFSMFSYAFNAPRGYNYGDAAIRGYLEILRYFVGRGLSEPVYVDEKKVLLDRFVLPRLEMMIEVGFEFDFEGFEAVFTEHYEMEPYYPEYLAEVRRIIALTGNR
ncbi:glycosyltransferase [Cohnella herbarum]|uniref:Glycosyltransferase n=1 Tax=Cohnella herbarum TaxID=2728023 RepID=A0A7Z2ZLU5_9BACL|nr:glycosyltransferase [Cohnella herbarum]QJD83452.1 glycosyltransferase [Cohnella herbarum]